MNRRTVYILTGFFALTFCLMLVYDVPVQRVSSRLSFLATGWTLEVHGEVYENVTTPRFGGVKTGRIREGDTVSLHRDLAAVPVYDQPALYLKTRASNVTVLLDDRVVLFHDHLPEGRLGRYAAETHYIDLPAGYENATLTIRLDVLGDNAFGGVQVPLIGSHLNLISYATYLGLLPIFVSLFLCMYAILFILMSVVLSSQMPALMSQIYAAILCLMIGIWMLGNYEVFSLLLDDIYSRFLEYVMQFGAIPVFYLYMRSLQLPYFQRYDRMLAISLSLLGLLIIALDFLFGLPTNLLMGIYIPLASVALWTVMRYFFHSVRVRDLEPSLLLQMFGLTVLLICCLLHILLYFLLDYHGLPRGVFGRNFMLIGVTFFQETQLVNFFFFITRLVAAQLNRSDLEELAYRDFLTRLPNRTDAEQVFLRMSQTSDDFCVVMLDLNSLKDVNDRYGHSEGDRFLMESAQAMRIAFGEGAYVSRVGGDEFVIVVEGEKSAQVERRLEALEAILSHLGNSTPDIERSIAYGYAFRHECAEPSHQASDTAAGEDFKSFFPDAIRREEERRKKSEPRRIVKTENTASSESKYVGHMDVVYSVISLADKRMYEKKRVMKSASR